MKDTAETKTEGKRLPGGTPWTCKFFMVKVRGQAKTDAF